jgi:hypothetical protein
MSDWKDHKKTRAQLEQDIGKLRIVSDEWHAKYVLEKNRADRLDGHLMQATEEKNDAIAVLRDYRKRFETLEIASKEEKGLHDEQVQLLTGFTRAQADRIRDLERSLQIRNHQMESCRKKVAEYDEVVTSLKDTLKRVL